MPELRRPDNSRRAKKIVGRGKGSGRGSSSGRGDKGQNSRSGGSVRPGFEGGQMPLYRRVARRGFSNYPFKRTAQPINLSELERRFMDGEVVSLESLLEKGMVAGKFDHVKILGSGHISKKLTLKGLAVSASASAKIAEAGGTVEGQEDVAATEAKTEDTAAGSSGTVTEEQDS